MSDSNNRGLRDSRDRIVDLLGLGETYPLRDVPVTDGLKVPFNTTARLLVAPSQAGVRYELRDDKGDGPPGRRDAPLERVDAGVSTPVAGGGDAGELELVTPSVAEDVTFTVFAAKRHPVAGGGDSLRAVFLHQRVRIKVGLDILVPARIPVDAEVEPLDPHASGDGDPRLIHHGATVTVVLDGAQEGVDYELVSDGGQGPAVVRSAGKVRGLGAGTTIAITSTPLLEDVDLRVRATKVFSVAENRQAEVVLLAAVLPVRVRADTGLVVTATPVIAHGAAAQVTIAATQASATYQLFARPIRDRDFVRLGAVDTVDVAVPDAPLVQIQRPAWARVWSTPAEMVAVGAPVAGTGGELVLPLGELVRDTLVVVRAVKRHAATGGSVETAVQLARARATLVGPDPSPMIELRVTMVGGATTGAVDVLGGQPGVFYHLRRSQGGADLGLPAYVHPRDDDDPGVNKGIGQLALEVDLAVARDPEGVVAGRADRRAPMAARVVAAPIEAGAVLHLHAVKAQTRLGVALARTAALTPVPAIANEHVGVDRGEPARIHVTPSSPGDSYRLWRAGAAVGAAQVGDGGPRVLVSEPVLEDMTFEVVVSPVEDRGIPVHRAVPVAAPLRPATGLVARIDGAAALDPDAPLTDVAARVIDHGGKVTVQVHGAAADVDYRVVELVDGGEAARSELVRGGGVIAIETVALAEDAILRVRAIRRYFGADDELAEPQQLLAAALPLAVRAAAGRTVTPTPGPIVDHGSGPSLTIAASQASVRYAAFVRPVADGERLFGGAGGLDALTVDVGDGAPPVRVVRPTASDPWQTPAGFVQRGDERAGNGGALALPLGPITDDVLVLVRAAKDYQVGAPRRTALPMTAATLLLVRPDCARALVLAVSGLGVDGGGRCEFVGGEGGCLYQLVDGLGATIGAPAFVDRGAGIGALRLEVDMAVARGGAGGAASPWVDGLTLAPGDALGVRATRALTGVAAPLTGVAALFAAPAIQPEASAIAAGARAKLVLDSVVGQRYRLTVDGAPVGAPIVGDGGARTLESDPLERDAHLVVEITRADVAGIAVLQRVAFDIKVS